MKRLFWTTIAVLAATTMAYGQKSSEAESQELQVPESKQTTLGLYVSAKEAYEKWQADPEGVKILDVRTPEEYVFVGHAEMARNIPFAFFVHAWDAEKNAPVMKPNPDFVAQVKACYRPDVRFWSLAGPEDAARIRSTCWPKRVLEKSTTSLTGWKAMR